VRLYSAWLQYCGRGRGLYRETLSYQTECGSHRGIVITCGCSLVLFGQRYNSPARGYTNVPGIYGNPEPQTTCNRFPTYSSKNKNCNKTISFQSSALYSACSYHSSFSAVHSLTDQVQITMQTNQHHINHILKSKLGCLCTCIGIYYIILSRRGTGTCGRNWQE
jgi:hypothetical protein